jgi:hypothetical protein
VGIEATKALQARRREAAARVDRLVVVAEDRRTVGSGGRARIKAAVRDGRRALRAMGAAEQALVELRARAGLALTRLTADGLSRNEAYQALGVSRAVGRRLLEPSGARRTSADVSPPWAPGRAAYPSPVEGETGAPQSGATSDEGIL